VVFCSWVDDDDVMSPYYKAERIYGEAQCLMPFYVLLIIWTI